MIYVKLPNLMDAKVRNKSEVKYFDANIVKDKSIFQNKKYYLKTYGCHMNVHDSELIKNLVEGIGFMETGKME